MTAWSWAIIGIVLVYAVFQWAYTRRYERLQAEATEAHRKMLEKHR